MPEAGGGIRPLTAGSLLGNAVSSPTFLITCVGATTVKGSVQFGSWGYSYQVVARRFERLLERLGRVVWLDRPETRLEYAVYRARRENQIPIRISFHPLQYYYPSDSCPHIVFPFWEFPDLPDQREVNHRLVGAEMAPKAALLMTACSFTAQTLARGGVRTPVRVVPVPIPEEWFAVPPWQGREAAILDVSGYEARVLLKTAEPPGYPEEPPPLSLPRKILHQIRGFYHKAVRPWLPATLDGLLTGLAKGCRADLRRLLRIVRPRKAQGGASAPALPPPDPAVRLSGIVYTMIVQPGPRKALHDLITAFVLALRDCADATLVLRLVSTQEQLPHDLGLVDDSQGPPGAGTIYRWLAAIPHRCRVVFLTGTMSEEQLRGLAAQTTYYVNATRAEGCCLPIQEMLAAGRPALSPMHTAMRDYFDASVGFVVESHAEPCPFPGDATGQLRTTRHRLVWQSLHDQFQASYALAHEPAGYEALAARARQRMREYASPEKVFPMLQEALAFVLSRPEPARPMPRVKEAKQLGEDRRQGSPSPLYIDASPMTDKEMTGIGRYVALLISYLARLTEVRVLIPEGEIPVTAANLPKRGADLGAWRDELFRLPRQPSSGFQRAQEREERKRDRFPIREGTCIYPFLNLRERRFRKEIGIVHDLSPLVVPGVTEESLRRVFAQYCLRQLPDLDGILCVSQATRADVAWLAEVDPARIEVCYAGPSLCFNGHGWRKPVRRSSHMLLVVGTHHPRKNGTFLFDWFWNTPGLPAGMELWWAGPNRRASRAALKPRHNPFGRRLCLLGHIADAELCRLYQTATCLIYPSLYEGFGFPVLDALLHGTPVLCGRHSSLIEFDGPGVFYFDPCDAASLDRAFLDLCTADPGSVQRNDLRDRCTWEGLATAVSRLCA